MGSMGIYKDVYLVSYTNTAILYVSPHTFPNQGERCNPKSKLWDNNNNCFEVRVDVYVQDGSKKTHTKFIRIIGKKVSS